MAACALLLVAAQGCLDGAVVDALATCEPACAAGTHCEETACVPDLPELCGNFEVDAGEECDAGPHPAEDEACGPDCQLRCGNGRLQAGEECDEGEQNGSAGGSCNPSCQLVACGNGRIDPGEGCDDGEANGAAGLCSASCTVHCADAPFEEPVVALSAAHDHLVFLGADGRLWGLGAGGAGELGQGDDLRDHSTPVLIPSPTALAIRSIATGWRTTFVIDEQGALYGTGMNEGGSLGVGRVGVVRTLTPIDAGPWRAISSGAFHTLGLKEDGTLWSWGDNADGQLGTGGDTDSLSPEPVGGGPYVAVAAGGHHSLALREDGTLLGFGANGAGEVGLEAPGDVPSPVPLVLPDGAVVRSIAAGYLWSFAVTEDGAVYEWGARYEVDQIPHGPTPERLFLPGAEPPRVARVRSLKQAAVAVDDAGRAYGWGISGNGQTGQGSDDPFRRPGLLEPSSVLEVGSGANYLVLLVAAGTPELPTARLLTAGLESLAVLGRGEAGPSLATLGPVCR